MSSSFNLKLSLQTFLLFVKSINLDLMMLSVSLFVISHSYTFLSSLFASDCKCDMSLDSKLRKVSSANRVTENLVALGRSLINIRKSRGPKTEPWGTPISIKSTFILIVIIHTSAAYNKNNNTEENKKNDTRDRDHSRHHLDKI